MARIEGAPRDAAASIARAAQSAVTAEIRPSETNAGAAAEPQRGFALELGAGKGSETIPGAGAEPPGYLEFETLVNNAVRRNLMGSRSPRQMVADFVEPWISDPTPFLGGRALSILERLASDIIPTLDESDELRALAGAIIADEIERHRELAMRLQDEIAL
jgi:hypothetical protein